MNDKKRLTEEDIRALSDEELEKAAKNLRKRADLQSALELADMRVARYEPPSEAVDRVFDRNLEISSRITTLQKWVRDEQARRAK